MNERRALANDLLQKKDYGNAVEVYNQCLGALPENTPKETIVQLLLGRSECCMELKNHEMVVSDCRRIIKLSNNNNTKAQRRLIHALFYLKKFMEAEAAAENWIASDKVNPEAIKTLERLQIVVQMVNSERSASAQNVVAKYAPPPDGKGPSNAHYHPQNEHMKPDGACRDQVVENGFLDGGENPNLFEAIPDASRLKDGVNVCVYCNVSFQNKLELQAHCQTESHQMVIMSDDGRDWKWRPPPRGVGADAYSLCERYTTYGICRFGVQCVEAHSEEELAEWKERFNYRQMKLKRAYEKELYGKSYTEQILEKWIQSTNPENVMKESVEDVEITCNDELSVTVSSKISQREWIFTINTRKPLQVIALLQDAHRNHFSLKQIFCRIMSQSRLYEWTPSNDQEWHIPPVTSNPEEMDICYEVKIAFRTDIYGTFRQSVVFEFGFEPVLVQHVCVDVVPVQDMDKVQEIKDMILSASERWDKTNSLIVEYVPKVETYTDSEMDLLNTYPAPQAMNFTLTESVLMEKILTESNYHSRMHELLYIEEMARHELISQYNLNTKVKIVSCYLLTPSHMGTAKYAQSGELFARMSLTKDISEDTCAGRLILNNCTMVLMSPVKQLREKSSDGKLRVFEAFIEDKGKSAIYLKLSHQMVSECNLKADTECQCEVQFQLNRIPYCEWHFAVDRISDFKIIFPDTEIKPSIPWTPQRQWNDNLDARLNPKQKEAVVAITTPFSVNLPPILIIGPFGTGKTYTLAQAIKQLLLQPNTCILVCTHSNSAADLYIKEYLHPYVQAGHEEARPLRIYYHKRWAATVNPVVQEYCLVDITDGMKRFRVPTLDDVLNHRVVVVTLNMSKYLSSLGLKKGHFTHLLLDEAAQAMECEAIMPLALATEKTRIVLAGDHMQLSPELFSMFAKERNLHVSLLERLYDHYPSTYACKILLCENYRAHEAIIHFTSELFYDQKLISSGKQPRHEKFYPLTFFTTRGEDVQETNSTAFHNNSEVYEIVERVCELKKNWPSLWGKVDDQSIGVMTPYADQVFRIRSELRKRRLGGISVERVLNVQGKQFRAVFLSTVRTRRTCLSGTKPELEDDMDYGFLSNSKLLNTAITRAQSLVAVIGDPVALCSIGRCRKVWERFIEICNDNNSLFGIKWSQLRSQLDGVELKKSYVLNPLAPEFIPRQFQGESFIRLPSLLGPYGGFVPNVPGGMNLRYPMPYIAPFYPYPIYCYPPYYQVRPPVGPSPFPFPVPPQNPPTPWMNSIVPSCVPSPMYPSLTGRSTPVGWNVKKKVPPPMLPMIQPSLSPGLPGIIRTKTPEPGKDDKLLEKPGLQGTVQAIAPKGPPIPNCTLPRPLLPAPAPFPFGVPHPSLLCLPRPLAQKIPFQSNPNNSLVPVPMANALIPQPDMNIQQKPHIDMMGKMQVNKILGGEKEGDKHIQFLHNVHFPEVSQEMQDNNDFRLCDKGPSEAVWSSNGGMYSSLLPPGMELSELLDSQSKQFEWYNHLLDSRGVEDATRFMELVILGHSQRGFKNPQNGNPNESGFIHSNNGSSDCCPPTPDVVKKLEDLFVEKSPVMPQAPPFEELPNQISVSHASPKHPQWFNRSANSQVGKPLTVSDLEASMLVAAQSHIREGYPCHMNAVDDISIRPDFLGSSRHMGNVYNQDSQGKFHADKIVPWSPAMEQQKFIHNGSPGPGMNSISNVALYGRHPMENGEVAQLVPHTNYHQDVAYGSEASAKPFIQPVPAERRNYPIADGIDKPPLTGSSAFAGYARAAVHIGLPLEMEKQDVMQPQPLKRPNALPIYQENTQFHRAMNRNQESPINVPCLQSMDEETQRTTYASVLRAQPQKSNSASPNPGTKNGDPFAILRELGTKGAQGTTGLYHYFS